MVVVKIKFLLVVFVKKYKKINFILELINQGAKIELENKNIGGVCQHAGGLRQLVFILIEYEFFGGVCQSSGWTSSTHFYLLYWWSLSNVRKLCFLANCFVSFNIS